MVAPTYTAFFKPSEITQSFVSVQHTYIQDIKV